MLTRAQERLIASLQQKKHRDETGWFVAEGPKLIQDFYRAGLELQFHLTTDAQPGWTTALTTPVTARVMAQLSNLDSPSSELAVFAQPKHGPDLVETAADELALVLDRIQNPGNLGTILRSADWFGVRTVYCSPDCADAFGPKVVQATMGALTRVRVVVEELATVLAAGRRRGVSVYAATLEGENCFQTELSRGGLVVLGNEGQGIRSGLLEAADRRLTIPAFSPAGAGSESLNVGQAATVLLAEFRRRWS